MGATALDLSAIRTDATAYAGTFRTLVGVYSEAEVDALIAGIDGLTAEDIDTLAEINAILTDANLASIAYVDGLASNYATAAQGTLADTALQPSDITSGTITAGTGDIDFDALGGGLENISDTGSGVIVTGDLRIAVHLRLSEVYPYMQIFLAGYSNPLFELGGGYNNFLMTSSRTVIGWTNGYAMGHVVSRDTKIDQSSTGVVEANNGNLGTLRDFSARRIRITEGIETLSGDTDPTTVDIPAGFGARWKNTTNGEIRDWVNDGGTMKKSAAYT